MLLAKLIYGRATPDLAITGETAETVLKAKAFVEQEFSACIYANLRPIQLLGANWASPYASTQQGGLRGASSDSIFRIL